MGADKLGVGVHEALAPRASTARGGGLMGSLGSLLLLDEGVGL